MSSWESSLCDDNIINEPADLAKLLFVLKSGIRAEDWPQKDSDLRQFVVEKVNQFFDDSGESATEFCFEAALDYGFIRIDTDSQTGLKRYVESVKTEMDLSHDWFCFECDVMVNKKNRQFLKCQQCLRVFHRKCIYEFETIKDYKCRFCQRLEESESIGFININQKVSRKRMSRLIGFLLDFIRNKMKKKFEETDLKLEENEYIYVFKKMNLSLMSEKVKREEYNSLNQFDDDFFVYMHNLHITQIHFLNSDKNQNFANLRTFLLKELAELRKCVDCYERANDKELHLSNKEWICLPCDPPHRPVFVKLSFNPYWPAKVIKYSEDKKKVEICFFEAEKVKEKSKGCSHIFNKSEVKSSDLKDINDLEILNQIKGNQRLIKPMDLLTKYLELIPENSLYEKTIEIVKQNNLTHKMTNKDKVYDMNDSINESIESVIQNNLKISAQPSKGSQRAKATNLKPKKTRQPTPKKKGSKKKLLSPQSSSGSTRSSSPQISIPVLPKMSNESNDSVDSLTEKVPDLNISESEDPPILDSYQYDLKTEGHRSASKRRSGRIAALITPQKTDLKKTIEVKPSKRKDQNKSIDESEQMECDIEESPKKTATNESSVENTRIDSQTKQSVPQSSQSVLIIVNKSEQNIPINETQNKGNTQGLTAIDSNITQKQCDSSQSWNVSESNNLKEVSDIPQISDNREMITTETTSKVTSASMPSTSSPSMISTSITSNVPPLVKTSSVSTPLMSAPLTTITPTSFEGIAIQNENSSQNINNNNPSDQICGQFDEQFERLNFKVNELLTMKGPMVSKLDLNERLILIQFYHTNIRQQFESMKQRLNRVENELRNAKSQRWCAICQKPAKHFCCFRFYCTKECQIIDWRRGHHFQCLDIKK